MAARANRTTRPDQAAQAKRATPGQPGKQSSRSKRTAGPVTRQADAPAAPAVPSGAGDSPVSSPESARPPKALQLAAAAQAIEALGVAVAGGFAAVSTVDGRSYTTTNGIALTVFLFVIAGCGLALAVGLSRAQPWSRVPAALTQLVVIAAGIALLDGHRPEWGVPALALAAACLVGLFTPASLKALNRQLD